MTIPLLIFEPLDLPPDIHIVLHDNCHYYAFNKQNGINSISFYIQKNTNLECYLLDNLKKTNIKVFDNIEYHGSNVNDFLWKISENKYEKRYTKLEIIERLRLITKEIDLKNILEFIRKVPIDGTYEKDEL